MVKIYRQRGREVEKEKVASLDPYDHDEKQDVVRPKHAALSIKK